jgi:hypothetical protein
MMKNFPFFESSIPNFVKRNKHNKESVIINEQMAALNFQQNGL